MPFTTNGIYYPAPGDVPQRQDLQDLAESVDVLVNALQPRSAIKNEPQSVVSSTALVDDSELSVAVDSNTIYVVRAQILYDGDPSGDLRVAWSVPTGAAMTWQSLQYSPTATAVDAEWRQQNTGTPTQERTIGVPTIGQSFGVGIVGLLLTVATSGTLQFRWAQGTSNATATRVREGSHIMLWQVGTL